MIPKQGETNNEVNMSVIITNRTTGKLIATLSVERFRQLTAGAGIAAHALVQRFNQISATTIAALI